MKKIWSKFLISFILTSFFWAPIGVVFNVGKIEVKTVQNVANAQGTGYDPTTGGYWIPTGAVGGGGSTPSPTTNQPEPSEGYSFGCVSWSGIDIPGCIAAVLYVVWEVAAWLPRLAGSFLDFFVYYAMNDDSYRSDFVERGWGIVRDIANMFFIVALVYVAIKTILSMNVSNNKKLVGYIIIVALLINFSLFVTKVVIDGSNILAKIFYNGITPVKQNGQELGPNDGGEKSISVGMADKFDPQKLVSEEVYDSEGPGIFIVVTVLSILITIYCAYIFMTVALVFVARVVSLWISMIFSPMAFISYVVPFDVGSFGHKKWWENLFKNAFLAPIFVFFLYLIVLFLDGGLLSTKYEDSVKPLQKIMGVVIPFAILFILLKKAKELAVEYSGEMGKAVMSLPGKIAGSVVGAGIGMAGGFALGKLAQLGRNTVGWGGNKLANSAWTKNNGSTGRWVGNVGRKLGAASFDARNVKVAGKDLSKVTGLNLGQGKTGGFVQAQKDREQKRMKIAERLNVSDNETEKQNLIKAESDLQEHLLGVWSHDLEKLDARIKSAREASADAAAMSKASPTKANKDAAKEAAERVKELVAHKKAVKNGNDFTPTALTETNLATRNYSTSARYNGKSIADYEDKTIPEAKRAIAHLERKRKLDYAKEIEEDTANQFWFRKGAAQSSAHKIRMGVKLDSGDKH